METAQGGTAHAPSTGEFLFPPGAQYSLCINHGAVAITAIHTVSNPCAHVHILYVRVSLLKLLCIYILVHGKYTLFLAIFGSCHFYMERW